MRNRLGLIILLLVWIGQCVVGAPDLPPVQAVPRRVIWLLVEDLVGLGVYQVRRLSLGPPPRTRSRRRRRRGGGAPIAACACPDDRGGTRSPARGSAAGRE